MDLAQQAEAWDQARLGGISPGMLRPTSNVFVVRKNIEILWEIRRELEIRGFERPEEDPWLFRKLFGVDQDGAIPYGPFKLYRAYSRMAAEAATTKDTATIDRLKQAMLELLDAEIVALGENENALITSRKLRSELKRDQVLIPPNNDSDRFLRYWKFLSRELSNLLSQLERLQRMRKGQPVPATIKVEIDS